MKKIRRGGSVQITVALSLLSAIGIILGKYLAFNVTEFMRFSLENITVIFTGIVFGPMLGAVVGAVQDIVGCIAVGYTINPLITLGAAMTGLVSGIIYRAVKRLPLPLAITLSTLISHAIGSVLIKSIGLAVFYSLPFGITVLWRILNYTIVGGVEATLLCFLLKSKQLLSQINKITNFNTTAAFKSVSDATEFVKGSSTVFSKPGLERVSLLLERLGNPQDSVKVIHVAGTNGKGSVSAMLTSILKASGLRVGSFNSPYLYEMRESIRIGGEPIDEPTFIDLLARLRPIADSMDDSPTEFELLTAAAYLAFNEMALDVAVVECGMGGRRDATNVINSPLISVITGIAIDHTAYLGESIREIAGEKAGIIKEGCPVIVGKTDKEALAVIEKVATALHADLTKSETPPRIVEMTLDRTVMSCDGIDNLSLPLLGIHQTENAALAIRAARLLCDSFPTVTDESIRQGIADVTWRGRFEILRRDPLFIFDGAHNLDGVRTAVKSIKTYFTDKIIVISGVLKDKEYEAMADEIATVSSEVITVTPSSPRALSADEYADVLKKKHIDAMAGGSITDAVKLALETAKKEGKSVVCLGSLYLYREISDAVNDSFNTLF